MSFVGKIATSLGSKMLRFPYVVSLSRAYSLLSTRIPQSHTAPKQLLTPSIPLLLPNCGFKVVGKPKKRCKDCYKVVRDSRLYVICKTKPRHKQMSMVKDEDKTWILSSATMGPKRPW